MRTEELEREHSVWPLPTPNTDNPLLYYLDGLNPHTGWENRRQDLTPSECFSCPFATISDHWEPPNPADPGEGYYDCALLGLHRVWGEQPKCSDDHWQKVLYPLYTSVREALAHLVAAVPAGDP